MNSNQLRWGLLVSVVCHTLLFLGSGIVKQPPQTPATIDVRVISAPESLKKQASNSTPVPSPFSPLVTSGTRENAHVTPTPAMASMAVSSVQTPQSGSSIHAHNEGGGTSARPDYAKNPIPEYPENARNDGIEGLVIVQVHVSEAGIPIQVALKKTSGHRELDTAAVKAVRHWLFHPALADGKPVVSVVDIPVRFQLH